MLESQPFLLELKYLLPHSPRITVLGGASHSHPDTAQWGPSIVLPGFQIFAIVSSDVLTKSEKSFNVNVAAICQ